MLGNCVKCHNDKYNYSVTYKFMSTDITISNRVHTVKMLTELLQNIND